MKTPTAKFLRNLTPSVKLWEVGSHYVVTSAVVVHQQGPETFVFTYDLATRQMGDYELPGSFKGALNHDRAIRQYLDRL